MSHFAVDSLCGILKLSMFISSKMVSIIIISLAVKNNILNIKCLVLLTFFSKTDF